MRRKFASPPFLPRVIRRSAVPRNSFARWTVVAMRPWMKRLETMFRSIASRCAVVRPSFRPLSRCLMLPFRQRRLLLGRRALHGHAEREPQLLQLLLHLAQRGLAEVAHLEKVRLGAADQLADRLDVLAGQAVRRADGEVELGDGHGELL